MLSAVCVEGTVEGLGLTLDSVCLASPLPQPALTTHLSRPWQVSLLPLGFLALFKPRAHSLLGVCCPAWSPEVGPGS